MIFICVCVCVCVCVCICIGHRSYNSFFSLVTSDQDELQCMRERDSFKKALFLLPMSSDIKKYVKYVITKEYNALTIRLVDHASTMRA